MPEGEIETPAPAATEGATPTDANLGDAGQRAIRAERDARKAAEDANKSLQAQLDQIRQGQMSDLEKSQATAKQFEQEATAAKSEALRWRIAAKHGISDEDAETFLTGSDEASLTKQAERLAALRVAAPANPKPDLSQGGKGEALALNSDGLEQAIKDKLGIV